MPSPPPLDHGLRPVRDQDAPAVLCAYRSAPDMARQGTERAKFLVGGERVDVLTYGRLRTDAVPAGTPLPWR